MKKSIETTAAAEFIKSQYYALYKRHRCLVFQKSISRFFDVTNNGPLAANTSQDDEKYHKGYWYREQKKKDRRGVWEIENVYNPSAVESAARVWAETRTSVASRGKGRKRKRKKVTNGPKERLLSRGEKRFDCSPSLRTNRARVS